MNRGGFAGVPPGGLARPPGRLGWLGPSAPPFSGLWPGLWAFRRPASRGPLGARSGALCPVPSVCGFVPAPPFPCWPAGPVSSSSAGPPGPPSVPGAGPAGPAAGWGPRLPSGWGPRFPSGVGFLAWFAGRFWSRSRRFWPLLGLPPSSGPKPPKLGSQGGVVGTIAVVLASPAPPAAQRIDRDLL